MDDWRRGEDALAGGRVDDTGDGDGMMEWEDVGEWRNGVRHEMVSRRLRDGHIYDMDVNCQYLCIIM